jgi:glyoxylase-like metal-dependent hydrolase (beta-lactamase superfamily II)
MLQLSDLWRRRKQERQVRPEPQRTDALRLSPHGAFERYVFSGGALDNNTYLLVSPSSRDAVLIDAAGDADELLRAVRERRARVRMILMTQGHADHWGALGRLRDTWGAPVGIHLDDADMLPLTPNFALAQDQRIAFGAAQMRVLHTPGPTPGSVCFYGDGHLFSGDTLFPGGPSETKSPLGDVGRLIRSLGEQIFTLPDSTFVFPGHGEPTTIGRERPSLDEWEKRG